MQPAVNLKLPNKHPSQMSSYRKFKFEQTNPIDAIKISVRDAKQSSTYIQTRMAIEWVMVSIGFTIIWIAKLLGYTLRFSTIITLAILSAIAVFIGAAIGS
jgi:hypothetical protein